VGDNSRKEMSRDGSEFDPACRLLLAAGCWLLLFLFFVCLSVHLTSRSTSSHHDRRTAGPAGKVSTSYSYPFTCRATLTLTLTSGSSLFRPCSIVPAMRPSSKSTWPPCASYAPEVRATAIGLGLLPGIPDHPRHLRQLSYLLLLGVLPADKRAWKRTLRRQREDYYVRALTCRRC
jgi:hypothetical protein